MRNKNWKTLARSRPIADYTYVKGMQKMIPSRHNLTLLLLGRLLLR
jgi:hypothetical protein